MSDTMENGSVNWVDYTSPHAEQLRDFYSQVTGWKPSPVTMKDDQGEYQDWAMVTESGKGVAGVCHARGINSDIPPGWLVYITVDNLEESVSRCIQLGGRMHGPMRSIGSQAVFCIIQDPAGAYSALFQIVEKSNT